MLLAGLATVVILSNSTIFVDATSEPKVLPLEPFGSLNTLE